ncbi:hypothetical protein FDENT_4428 [Fusarium denticulatum]|uniref:Uncharacterized protein n=1 Tax=Fusarium denticulatum TaxID=48507 RepID=A0A8H5UGY4_9HYPO|nr:hypothetical protein FDENT_4428 [Fusarium denticulatum]
MRHGIELTNLQLGFNLNFHRIPGREACASHTKLTTSIAIRLNSETPRHRTVVPIGTTSSGGADITAAELLASEKDVPSERNGVGSIGEVLAAWTLKFVEQNHGFLKTSSEGELKSSTLSGQALKDQRKLHAPGLFWKAQVQGPVFVGHQAI